MSPRDWVECPNCRSTRAERIAKAEKELAEKYGKIDLKAWKHQEACVAHIKSVELERSLRVDYGFSFGDDMKLKMWFEGSCDDCDFVVKQEFNQQ